MAIGPVGSPTSRHTSLMEKTMATVLTIPTFTPDGPILDATPAALADTLDRLVQPLMLSDREVAAILANAREGLRCLAATRYAIRKSRESARRAKVRRLGRHSAAWRARR